MSDHDFEKRVQQKMEELKFQPSEPVWLAVERQIRKDKRRRRGLLLLPILLIVLGVGAYQMLKNSRGVADTAVATDQQSGSQNALSPSSSQSETTAQDKTSVNEKEKTLNTSESNPEKTATAKTDNKIIQPVPSSNDGIHEKQILNDKISTKPVLANKNNINKKETNNRDKLNTTPNALKKQKQSNDLSSTRDKLTVNDKKDLKSQTEKNAPAEKPVVDEVKTDEIKDTKKDLTTTNTEEPTRVDSNGIAKNQDVPAVDTTKNISDKKTEAVAVTEKDSSSVAKNKKKKPYPWQFGLNGSAGVSQLNDGLSSIFKGSAVADVAIQSAPLNFAGSVSGFGRVPPQASAVTPGFSFSIGGFVRKQFSDRFSVSAGLQYTLYNTHIDIGYRVDSSRLVNSGPQVLNVSNYYRADRPSGQTTRYTNQYHFLELPVVLHTQLNRSKTLPVYWNLGVSVGQLLSTNALHFDSGTGVYYEDNDLFHKTQLGLLTGFSAGIFSKSKTPLWIGPTLRYNASSLMNNNPSDRKHLLSFGLDIKLFLKK